ncbi:uncharacterized protein BJX67DRAFT_358761 [Aspergillus lucknowensis]|uniref:Uncharacterized protein n=1 Tax=Aspergillus lucknowensis TaxID=176173 RepID=A0ABR4LPS2_9EURO
MLRIKNGPTFLRNLFSRCSKRRERRNGNGNGKRVKSSNSASGHSHSLPRTNPITPLEKELEILGLLTDPRKEGASTSMACTRTEPQRNVYHNFLSHREPEPEPKPLPMSPLLPPKPSLWLPIQQPPRPVSDTLSEETVLVLPTPPGFVRAYGMS